MNNKERVIDIRQFFLYLWENIIVIILVTAIFTVGMTGLSYFKQKKELASYSNVEELIIDSIIKKNHDAYYKLNNATANSDAEPIANTYNCSARLIVDFNYSNIEGYSNQDLSSMTNKFQQDALLLFVNENSLQKVIDELKLNQDADMKGIYPSDLKWMINRSFSGANVMQIVVSDVNAERAKRIADATLEEFINNSKDYPFIDSVEIVDNTALPKNGMTSSVNVQNSISKKKLLKYAVVGFMGGLIFIIAVYLLIFIFTDAVRNSTDISYLGMDAFGIILKRKKAESSKRLAYNISLLDCCKVISFIPVNPKANDFELFSSVAENLSKIGKNVGVIETKDLEAGEIQGNIEKAKKNNDIVLINSEDIKEHADAMIVAACSDVVLINAVYGKTRMKDLIFASFELDRTGTKIAGVILDDVKHN